MRKKQTPSLRPYSKLCGRHKHLGRELRGRCAPQQNEVKGFLADSGAIFTGIGMGAEDASVMSEMMTSLSYDLASFNNLADEDAFNKLRRRH